MPPTKGSRCTTYECPRCGWAARNKAHYRIHASRLTLCDAKDAASASVIPSMDNALVRHVANGVALAPAATVNNSNNSSNNNSNNTTHNNTTTNNHNVTNINVRVNMLGGGAAGGPELPFPKQDTSYMTERDRIAIARLAGHPSGFNEALVELFKAAYFNPARMHNVNMLMLRPGDTAVVRDDNRRWVPTDGPTAVRRMIEHQTEALEDMREVLYGQNKLDKGSYDRFDKTWDALPNLQGDEHIQAHVKDRAIDFTESMLGSLGSVLHGLASCKAVQAARDAQAIRDAQDAEDEEGEDDEGEDGDVTNATEAAEVAEAMPSPA